MANVGRGQDYEFTTLAGYGFLASVDGGSGHARFTSPTGVAIDRAGNIYVADAGAKVIRKILPAGQVTTIAGAIGESGSADGRGLAARFDVPEGIALDAIGNLYVADTGNQLIRKIAPDGVVTTVAGTAREAGNVDGVGAAARFYNPVGIAVDGGGDVYVADSSNNEIRRIAPNGSVTTFAGSGGYYGLGFMDGARAVAKFNSPMAIAFDSTGALLVADQGNCTIRKISPTGFVTTVAGKVPEWGSADGKGTAARFGARNAIGDVYGPAGLTVDALDIVYVADTLNGTIRKITPDGTVSTLAGSAGQTGSADGNGAEARFSGPAGLAVDGGGSIYIADANNELIRKATPSGKVTTVAGLAPPSGSKVDGLGAAATFFGPIGVVLDSAGNLFVADSGNCAIRRIDPRGSVATFAGSVAGNRDGNGDQAQFEMPSGIAMDRGGNLYVSDTRNQTIRKITPGRDVTTFAGTAGSSGYVDGVGAAARFNSPMGLAFDAADNLYVADQFNSVIRKIMPDGRVTTFAGTPGSPGSRDGAGISAQFHAPLGLAIDRAGNVYVADAGNQTIRKIAPNGDVTTLAGAAEQMGSADGAGAAARFSSPAAVAVDADGNVFVGDGTNYTLRKITPAGFVSTIGGAVRMPGAVDGSGETARFYNSAGLAVDKVGNIYIADFSSGKIRKGEPIIDRTPGATARLVNISSRAYCGTGSKVTIGGFVIAGSGSKHVLVRAVGPSLVQLGLGASEVLLDPTVEVHQGAAVIASNDNWNDGADAQEITQVSARVGAYPLAGDDAKSSALLLTLPAGVYSFIVQGKAELSGIVLLEIYDADPGNTSAYFTNIATRAYSTTGNGVTIGGFVVVGTTPIKVMLRGVGPTLVKAGLPEAVVLSDPILELHEGSPVIATADDYGFDYGVELIVAGARLGAMPLEASDTKSSALLLTLSPGAYSFIARAKDGGSGVVLVEAYDAD